MVDGVYGYVSHVHVMMEQRVVVEVVIILYLSVEEKIVLVQMLTKSHVAVLVRS